MMKSHRLKLIRGIDTAVVPMTNLINKFTLLSHGKFESQLIILFFHHGNTIRQSYLMTGFNTHQI